ncbi:hypothetical protein H9P43_003977 [Blastocladiella emersonii ATCC 22665]|nr:hypothetical protein H9P43_003977 [Blastocladiella emersonii ATCC 22665]
MNTPTVTKTKTAAAPRKRARTTKSKAPPTGPALPTRPPPALPTAVWRCVLGHLDRSSYGDLLLLRGVSRGWRDVVETQLDGVHRRFLARLGVTELAEAGFRTKTGKPSKRKPKAGEGAVPTAAFNTVVVNAKARCFECGEKRPANLLFYRVTPPTATEGGKRWQQCLACRVQRALADPSKGTPISFSKTSKGPKNASATEITRSSAMQDLGIPGQILDFLPERSARNNHPAARGPMKLFKLGHIRKVVFELTGGSMEPVVMERMHGYVSFIQGSRFNFDFSKSTRKSKSSGTAAAAAAGAAAGGEAAAEE